MEIIDIFKNIKEESKIELKTILKTKALYKNEVLFHEKDFVDKVYFIKTGKISTYKINANGERKVIFILKRGDMLNEVFLDKTKNTSFGCDAFENTTLLYCQSDDLVNLMKNDFELTKNIMLHTQNINRRLYRQLKNTISIKIDKKLAAKLYRIGKEFGIKIGEWTLINADITITYIADMLGCKRESLSRAMRILQDYELVKIESRRIYIKEKELARYFKEN